MLKGFVKGALYCAVAGTILNILLGISFQLLLSLGVIHTTGNNPLIIIGIYAFVFLIYLIMAIYYSKRASSKNLAKLKQEVEKISGKIPND